MKETNQLLGYPQFMEHPIEWSTAHSLTQGSSSTRCHTVAFTRPSSPTMPWSTPMRVPRPAARHQKDHEINCEIPAILDNFGRCKIGVLSKDWVLYGHWFSEASQCDGSWSWVKRLGIPRTFSHKIEVLIGRTFYYKWRIVHCHVRFSRGQVRSWYDYDLEWWLCILLVPLDLVYSVSGSWLFGCYSLLIWDMSISTEWLEGILTNIYLHLPHEPVFSVRPSYATCVQTGTSKNGVPSIYYYIYIYRHT